MRLSLKRILEIALAVSHTALSVEVADRGRTLLGITGVMLLHMWRSGSRLGVRRSALTVQVEQIYERSVRKKVGLGIERSLFKHFDLL